MATAFTLNPKDSQSKIPAKSKKSLGKLILSVPNPDRFFADSNWNGTGQWQIKLSQENFASLSKALEAAGYRNSSKSAGSYVGEVDGTKIKLIVSGKASAGGAGGAADAKTTRMQELGSAWIIRRAIKDNIKYKTWEDIRKDPKYKELVSIYPAVDDDPEWLQGYYAQQKKMLEEFSDAKFDEFNREGGFMDYISKLVASKYGISKKDTWNPADIWLIQNEKAVIADIKSIVEGSKASQTIEELNAVLRKMFKERRVVGISLKKISGKVARYEEYNVDDEGTGLDDNYMYEIKSIKCDLTWNGKGFGTQDSTVIVGGPGEEYKFQIKGNDTAKISNLKFEPTAKGATAARMGKAPLEMVSALIADNGLSFKNENKEFPKNAAEFEKSKAKFIKAFNTLKAGKVDTKVSGSAEFAQNMKEGLSSKDTKVVAAAHSKLMQLSFIADILSLPLIKRNKFMTDMVFIAAKKGDKFGPFGKLY